MRDILFYIFNYKKILRELESLEIENLKLHKDLQLANLKYRNLKKKIKNEKV